MYYHQGTSEIQAADGLHTLYLMNPNYPSDTTHHHAPPQFEGIRHPLSHYADIDKPTASTGNCSSSSPQSVIMGSKYLKAAQQLLHEVANVGNTVTTNMDKPKIVKDHSTTAGGGDGGVADYLTTPQRQEIQIKKAKLNTMLYEVEQRYREYYEEMQIVEASFEQVGGVGSARSYTQLTLNTILKQFRRLKASISAQIKALGEDESKLVDGSRRLVRFADHQNIAWRPQRGLPERAVSVLRAWLFDHFLHPYPKDSDKHMLAKQTGLTRSQVSNWFINARVRLWKPMVEEMYHEEMKNQQQISSNEDDHDQEINTTEGILSPCLKSDSRQRKKARRIDHEPSKHEVLQSKLILNLENVIEKNPKKDNSPSSIFSVHQAAAGDLQTGIIGRINNNNNNNNVKFSNYDQMIACSDQVGMLFHADQQQQQQQRQQLAAATANNFSLSLGLPPSQGAHQHSFITRINGVDHNQARDFLPDHFNWWRQRF